MVNYPNTYRAIYNIIRDFKGKFKRNPKRIELLKLLYLLDVDYYKTYGEKYTELGYIYYHHGPWTKDFHSALDYMRGEEILEVKLSGEDQKEFYLYTLTGKVPRHETDMDSDAKRLLDNNLFIFEESSLAQLLNVVYTQEPMASTKSGEPIDFSRLKLNARDAREQYSQKRRKKLEKIESLQNNITEDDLDLFNEFKPLRDRANKEI